MSEFTGQKREFNEVIIRPKFDSGSSNVFDIKNAAGAVKFSITPAGAATPVGGVEAAGGFSASPRNVHTGMQPATATTSGNNSTPVTTETYIGEVFVPCNMTVTGIAVFNGSDVTGNMNVGLADSDGVNVAESADTAGSGTDAYQLVPFTSTYATVGPATYFITIQYSSGTARYNTHTVGSFGASKKTGETFGTFTTITPPTTFTTNLANIASLY